MNQPERAAAADVSRMPPSGVTTSQTVFERCLHVLTLSSLAVAQPLLDLLARSGEFLIAHRFSRGDALFLVVSAMLLIPLPALVVEVLLARAPRGVVRAVHGLIVASFAGLFWVLVLKRSGLLPGPAVMVLAALSGLLSAAIYLWARWARFFVSVLALSLIAIPAVFLSSAHIRTILTARGTAPSQLSMELPTVRSTAPIVMIVFDEFATSVLLDEGRQINPHRYPTFAGLARTSSWFANALSVAEVTNSALPAIVTGNYPRAEKLPTAGEYPDNLFTLFGGSYDIWAQEPITELCPAELNLQSRPGISRVARFRSIFRDLVVVYLQILLPEPYNAKLPSISGKWRDFGGQEGEPLNEKNWFARSLAAIQSDRRQELDRLASTIRKGSRPALYFLHVLLPHRPWEFLPDGRRYPGGEYIPGLAGTHWGDDERHAQQAYQRYILQMRYVDTAVGRIVRRLEEEGMFDDSLIVLLGDHGTSFRPGDTQRLISETNDHEIIPVPLLIKAPGQNEARVVEHPVRIIDVLPTMLDILEIEAPWEMESRSGFDDVERDYRFVTKERGTLEVDPAIHQDKYDTVRWKLDLFGDGDDARDLFRFGPAGNLIGRPAAELLGRDPAPPAEPAWTVAIDNSERFDKVTEGDGVPVLVTGSVAGPDAEPCCQLAIAIDGKVVATTWTHAETGGRRPFSVMIPADALRQGAHQVGVYRITGDDSRLAPLQTK